MPECVDTVSKVEMSAGTIAALRGMMRDEIRSGMLEMEERFNKHLASSIGELREELNEEKTARKTLEQRLVALEERKCKPWFTPKVPEDPVDKSVVVLGGFLDKAVEEVESLVGEMMVGIAGYQDVDVIEVSPPIALAKFDSPLRALKFLRSQRKNDTIQTNKLWASENRSKAERIQCKLTSKIKKYLIELGNFDAKDVFASYKSFKVSARKNGKLVSVASVTTDGEVRWDDEAVPGQEVMEAMDSFAAELLE